MIVGFLVIIACFLRYSSFMDRVNKVDSNLANSLLADGGEGGERKCLLRNIFSKASSWICLTNPFKNWARKKENLGLAASFLWRLAFSSWHFGRNYAAHRPVSFVVLERPLCKFSYGSSGHN